MRSRKRRRFRPTRNEDDRSGRHAYTARQSKHARYLTRYRARSVSATDAQRRISSDPDDILDLASCSPSSTTLPAFPQHSNYPPQSIDATHSRSSHTTDLLIYPKQTEAAPLPPHPLHPPPATVPPPRFPSSLLLHKPTPPLQLTVPKKPTSTLTNDPLVRFSQRGVHRVGAAFVFSVGCWFSMSYGL